MKLFKKKIKDTKIAYDPDGYPKIHFKWGHCPDCGKMVDENNYKKCDCGRRIDWEMSNI